MDDSAMERLFNAAPVSLMVLDPKLTMVAATDKYLANTMTTREAIIGRHVLAAFPDNAADPDKVLVRSLARVLATGRPDSVPVQGYDIPKGDGEGGGFEQRFWSVINTPVLDEDGSIAYIIHRADDVTDVVRGAPRTENAEEAWSVLTQGAVIRRALELQQANEALRQADLAKNVFLSRMSHELRTPLNAVIGFAQLLQMSGMAAEDHENVDHVLKAGRHLLGLINDVLDLSGVESGQMALSLEAVYVNDVLAETLDLLGPSAAARSITMSTRADGPRSVQADRQRLKQVLLNIGSNAIKYNAEGGTVSFSVAAVGDAVEVAVSDNGPGIAPRLQERLFTPFERLGAEQSAVEGTGLGLAVSRTLTEAMGGTIRVESAVGAGSTFAIRLPPATPPTAERADLPAERFSHAVGAGSVLYIEDNPANLELVARLVERLPSVHLLTAMQGSLGIELAQNHAPALVLLDLNLPDIPGEQVLARLKADRATSHIPVAIVSADASPRQMDRLRQAGAVAYITKPFDLAEVVALLGEHLPA